MYVYTLRELLQCVQYAVIHSCVCMQALYYVSLDKGHSSLLTISLDHNEVSSPNVVLQSDNVTITDIAVDWMNEDIYFINSMSSSIEVWDVNTNVTTDIISSLENPRKLLYSFSMR